MQSFANIPVAKTNSASLKNVAKEHSLFNRHTLPDNQCNPLQISLLPKPNLLL